MASLGNLFELSFYMQYATWDWSFCDGDNKVCRRFGKLTMSFCCYEGDTSELPLSDSPPVSSLLLHASHNGWLENDEVGED